jgi:hypothetical protein
LRYLCLIHAEGVQGSSSPPALRGGRSDAFEAQVEQLRASGRLIVCEWLAAQAEVAFVRVRDGCVSVLDGPLERNFERLAGVCLIEARDLNEAIRIGTQVAPGSTGTVEIRPVRSRVPRPRP